MITLFSHICGRVRRRCCWIILWPWELSEITDASSFDDDISTIRGGVSLWMSAVDPTVAARTVLGW